MTDLSNVSGTILKKCMGLKKDESCLIVFDRNKADIALALFKAAKKITKKPKLLKIPVGKIHGEEQPKNVADQMKNNDVIIITTTMSLSHTEARKTATANKARIASMPGITEEMLLRAVDVDYDAMKKRTHKLVKALTKGSAIRISTEAGTNIKMDISGLKCFGVDSGIYNKPGLWGNLPSGEACMAPKNAEGDFIVDASMGGIGKMKDRIIITVEQRKATLIEGAQEARQLNHMLACQADESVYNIAEIGIGTNDKAIITGNVLEDEKVLGTAHIALGDNTSYDGGTVKSPVHLDGVFKQPTIYVDEKKVMEKGKIII